MKAHHLVMLALAGAVVYLAMKHKKATGKYI